MRQESEVIRELLAALQEIIAVVDLPGRVPTTARMKSIRLIAQTAMRKAVQS